ncbi:hypothetical protein ABH931_002671 [Streptacidiphilus sp. MAP12-33]|uniref:hypothetical protein n=1 Tax=Streptacidiphilus sp. MAP12-33 TaxID=3156266 RepID=UPI0035173325
MADGRYLGACHRLGPITAEHGRRGVTVHVLLDFVYVAEHLWSAAHALCTAGSTEAEGWEAGRLIAILSGDAARAAIRARSCGARVRAARNPGEQLQPRTG